jgi:hypothetical protein
VGIRHVMVSEKAVEPNPKTVTKHIETIANLNLFIKTSSQNETLKISYQKHPLPSAEPSGTPGSDYSQLTSY